MNACLLLTLSLSLLFLLLLAEGGKRETYVVYMGAVPDDASAHSLKQSHLQLLSSVLKREQQRVEEMIVRRYEHGFSGFAAKLLQEEAAAIGEKDGVVSVFRDPMLQLHTTRSWDFLQERSEEEADTNHGELPAGGSDTIVGVLDTGIWPESKSFDDGGMGEVPGRWKGVCMTGTDFSTSNCNKKLIGARYYSSATSNGSPRDDQGHGSHTSSTAAGKAVSGASYYGAAPGTAKGGSTASRIAMYKVCGWRGCPGSALLSGFDDAVADGVDLLSVSIGSSAYARPDYSTDPIAIGAFHAVANGITVVCSAGNDGPYSGTVVNAAPWIFTVAATTIDRKFESDVVLGGSNEAVKGESINFSNLEKSAVYPLIYGGSATSNSSDDASASHCEYGALDANKIKGKIVLCYHSDDRDSPKSSKADIMQISGAIGAIFVQDAQNSIASTYITFPATEITSQAAANIFTYINSTKNPVATILPTITVDKYKPAPDVASFSSRGPSAQTSNILKPDIAAPGVNILASWIPTNGSSEVPPGQEPSTFHLDSGTSMSCPHVTGVAATIKSWNPTWSPSAIRSAIMTTGGGADLPPTIPSKTWGMTTRLTTSTLGTNDNSSGGGIGSNPRRSSSNLNVTTRVAPTSSLGINLNSSEPLQRTRSDDTFDSSAEDSIRSTSFHASDARNSVPKKMRGFSRAIKTSNIMLTSGKRIEIYLDEDLGVPVGQVRNISSLLSHECGYQVRNNAPLTQAHWDDIDEDTMQKLIDGVTTNFEIDTKDPRWYKYICDNMRNRYNDYKHKLAKYYKSCESDEVARENPPLELLRERDLSEWEWLCDHFMSDKYRKRSEVNSINRSKKPWNHCGGSRPFSLYYHDHVVGGSQFPDIDTWGTTHMSKKKKDWVNDTAKDAHDEMMKKKNDYLEKITELYPEGTPMDELVVAPNVGTEIMEDVIGRGCGRTIRGAGKRRIRETSSSSSPNISSFSLNKEVQELQAQLQMEKNARMRVVAEHEEQKAQWGFVMQQLQVLVPGFSIPEPAPLSHEDDEDGDESDHNSSDLT